MTPGVEVDSANVQMTVTSVSPLPSLVPMALPIQRLQDVVPTLYHFWRNARRYTPMSTADWLSGCVALHGGTMPDQCCRPSCCCCLVSVLSLTLCTWAYTMGTRRQLREKYKLEAKPCPDCCVHFWWEVRRGS